MPEDQGVHFPWLAGSLAGCSRVWGRAVPFPVMPCLCPQVAVCNLASIALNMYVTPEHTYDFKKLAEVTKVIVRNLNKIIDINYYPVPEVSAGLGLNPAQGSLGHKESQGSSVNHLFPGGTCQCLPEFQPPAAP